MANIEKEINQKEFESSRQKAIVNLIYTYNQVMDSHQKIFKKFELLPQHFNILRIIKGNHPEPVSPGYIKEVMLDKSPDLTRLLDKLVNRNLITRKTCEENRRKIDINLTKQGIKLIQQINPEIKKMMKKFGKDLSEKEAELLSDLLDKLRG